MEGDHIVVPLGEEHFAPIVARKDDIFSRVEGILPAAKLEKVSRRFSEKLDQVKQVLRDCTDLDAELRELHSLGRVFLGDVLREAKISVDYGRNTKAGPTFNCPVAKPERTLVESSEGPKAPSNVEIVVDSPSNTIIPFVTSEEFETIPKYMRGRMTISELNEIVCKFDEFLSLKRRMLNANFKKLNVKDKDQVSKWREEEPAAIAGQLFCQEADVKPQLKDRTRLLLRVALPCLRHVKRIKEVRVKGQLYLLPI